MKYFVFKNDRQIKEIKSLKKTHDVIVKDNTDDFLDLFKLFIKQTKNDEELLFKPVIGRDIFPSFVRQIIYSFKELKKVEKKFSGDYDSENNLIGNIRNSTLLIFFISGKSFLDIIKKYNIINWEEDFEKIYKDISTIRNFLVHSYDKDFFDKEKVVARLNPNHHFDEGLYKLEIYNSIDGDAIGTIIFSIDVFYYKLRDIFKKVVES